MDWNEDGKKDLISGRCLGEVKVFLNTGTDAAPIFNGSTDVKVNGAIFDYGYHSTPDIVDWNGDGKKDVVCGDSGSRVFLLLNSGTDANPSFDNSPFITDNGGTQIGSGGGDTHPVVFDWDRDGKKDLLTGDGVGNVRFYRNIGTDNAPAFSNYVLLEAGPTNSTIAVGSAARPEIVDWDNDGYEDLIVGAYDGKVHLYRAKPIINLTIPSAVTEGDGVLSAQGSVSIAAPAASDTVITLTSLDTSEITVPPTVTIPAGSSSATFDVTVLDDSDLDGSKVVVVTASYPACGAHKRRITVDDNESTTLSVSLPALATEGDGVLAGQGTVSIPVPTGDDVLVTLASSDSSEVTTVASTIITSGQTSATFDLTVIEDTLIDGPQVAWVTAHVDNWTDGSNSMTIADNEHTNLIVTIPTLVGEGDGVLSGVGNVTISGALPSDLVVSLSSDDTGELTVPATVTISVGQTSANFNLTVIDDVDADGRQTATVTGSHASFASGNDSTTVADNEIQSFSFTSISSTQTIGVGISMTITALDINGQTAWFQDPATLTASGDGGAVAISPSAPSFGDGTWSGSVAVNGVDTGITLYCSDGNGHDGTSDVFSIEAAGSVEAFEWNTIPAQCYQGVPIPVTITAVDANGFIVPTFEDAVDLAVELPGRNPEIGSGTVDWWYLLWVNGSRVQTIYPQSEVGPAGRITSLSLDVTTIPGGVMSNWTIRLRHTPLANYNAAEDRVWVTNGWTTVYQADQVIDETGWVEFTFTTPFDYNGTDNLMVDFSFPGDFTGAGYIRCTDDGSTSRTMYCDAASYRPPDPLTWGAGDAGNFSRNAPNIRIKNAEPVRFTPAASGNFSNGVWSGHISVLDTEHGVHLNATNGAAQGLSGVFDVGPCDIRIFADVSGIGSDLRKVDVGDMTPDTDAGTHFGSVTGLVSRIFVITNTASSGSINLTNNPFVTLSGGDGNFTLTRDCTVGTLAPGETTRFEVTYNPQAIGTHSATVTVASTSAAVPAYTFAVGGALTEAPIVANAVAVGVEIDSATLSGLLSSGVGADAWICWGATDGGTASTANWDNVVSAGFASEGVAFSSTVSGLISNSTYWYRCYVSNPQGSDWSDSAASFAGEPASTGGGGNLTSGINYYQITSDSDCGITNTSTYTHAIDWGSSGAATVNGVVFANDVNVSAGSRSNSGTRTYGPSNNGGNTPPAVSGSVESLFRDMRYGGPDLGYIELTGLTPGKWYDVRLYDRAWDYNGAIRTFNAEFDVGGDGSAEYTTPTIDQNRGDLAPPAMPGNVSWAMSCIYQSDSSGKLRVTIDLATSTTYHLYALTNEELDDPVWINNAPPDGISSSSANLNAELGAWMGSYDVYVFYGTSNGGTNAGSWTSSALVGSWTNVSTNVRYSASLSAGQTYYYAFMASNATETLWATPSWQFATPGTGAVTVNHAVPHAWLAGIDPGWTNDYEYAATNDADGDGFSTAQEYWSGTDPTNSTSYLRLDSTYFDGTSIHLEWQHSRISGGIPPISIETRPSISTGQWIHAGQLSPVNGDNTWSEFSTGRGFYRLCVTNMP